MGNGKAGHLRTNIGSHQPCMIEKKITLSKIITLIKENADKTVAWIHAWTKPGIVPGTRPPEGKTNQLAQTASCSAL